MLFMVIENFRPGQAPAIYRRFREKGRMAPAGVQYISSWVDLGFGRCFQVMEAESANWDDLIDFEVIAVRTSTEAAAAIESQSVE